MDKTVLHLDGNDQQQDEEFRLCPLGMQFHSAKFIPEYKILELKLKLPKEWGGDEKTITCSGYVALCYPSADKTRHKVWLKFFDLPDRIKTSLRAVCQKKSWVCPHCLNFQATPACS